MQRPLTSGRIYRRQLLRWAAATGIATLGGCAAQPAPPLRMAIQP